MSDTKGLAGRKVAKVRLHSSTHVEGIGSIGPDVYPDSKGQLGKLELTMNERGVVVKLGAIEAFIPDGNIVSCTLAK